MVWPMALRHNASLHVIHIAGILNKESDRLSWTDKHFHKWSIKDTYLDPIFAM